MPESGCLVEILGLLPMKFGNLGKLLSFFMPQYIFLQNRSDIVHLSLGYHEA